MKNTASDQILSDSDIDQLAKLHMQALPDSVVTWRGATYVRRFYRFVNLSSDEHLFVLRDDEGRINNVAVISFSPDNLQRRLLTGTPLLLFAGLRPWHLPLLAIFKDMIKKDYKLEPGAGLPELIIIFVDNNHQSHGQGKILLSMCEQALSAADFKTYRVKTKDDPNNAAIGFYQHTGYEMIGKKEEFGAPFIVFIKNINVIPQF